LTRFGYIFEISVNFSIRKCYFPKLGSLPHLAMDRIAFDPKKKRLLPLIRA